jgi:Spy/CpxP family protein refolding chaperone
MKSFPRSVIGVVALTLLVAVLGGWLGVQYGLRAAHPAPGLDEVLHHELHLTSDQEQRLAALESKFAARRQGLEANMRSANRDLAAAITAEHQYGPLAEQAIDHFHMAMRTLQEETIVHILAMRAVLTPEQAQQFDRTVSQVLTSDQP